MAMTIPSVCRRTALPMFVLIQSYKYVWQVKESVFPITFGYKLKVSLSRQHIYFSFPVSIKENTPILQYLLCLWTVLAFHKFHGLFGNFPVGLISWICMNTLPAKHNQLEKTASICSTRQRLRYQHKKKRSCLNRWQYQVYKRFNYKLGNFQLKEIFKRKT